MIRPDPPHTVTAMAVPPNRHWQQIAGSRPGDCGPRITSRARISASYGHGRERTGRLTMKRLFWLPVPAAMAMSASGRHGPRAALSRWCARAVLRDLSCCGGWDHHGRRPDGQEARREGRDGTAVRWRAGGTCRTGPATAYPRSSGGHADSSGWCTLLLLLTGSDVSLFLVEHVPARFGPFGGERVGSRLQVSPEELEVPGLAGLGVGE